MTSMPIKPTLPVTSKRDLALEVAESLLRDNGYLGVSMELVARGSGIRKAGLYHHFPQGKEQMMMEVAMSLLDRGEIGFRAALGDQLPVGERLSALAQWMLSEGRHIEQMVRDVIHCVGGSQKGFLYGNFERRLLSQVRGVLDQGVQSGELRIHDTELSTWAFMGLLSEFAVLERSEPKEVLAAKLVEFFGRGVYSDSSP